MPKKTFLVPGVIFLLVIFIDQATKLYLNSTRLLPLYFNENVGFSLPIPWYIPWIFLVGVGIYMYAKKIPIIDNNNLNISNSLRTLLYISLSFIIAGGLSNIIDRILHAGRVIDFIDLKFWPVFNIADVSIVLGGTLFLFYYYKITRKTV
jgi:lipoprotein signal peptidase